MKEGFTLIETLVVLSIIATLSIVSLTVYKTGQKNLALLKAANFLVFKIREAQAKSLSMGQLGGQYPPGGYGIYLRANPQTIVLFADNNGNKTYQPSEMIENISLDNQIFISSLSPSPLNIVFVPPHPTTVINNNQNIMEATIVLSNGSQQITIKVNKVGLISIE